MPCQRLLCRRSSDRRTAASCRSGHRSPAATRSPWSMPGRSSTSSNRTSPTPRRWLDPRPGSPHRHLRRCDRRSGSARLRSRAAIAQRSTPGPTRRPTLHRSRSLPELIATPAGETSRAASAGLVAAPPLPAFASYAYARPRLLISVLIKLIPRCGGSDQWYEVRTGLSPGGRVTRRCTPTGKSHVSGGEPEMINPAGRWGTRMSRVPAPRTPAQRD